MTATRERLVTILTEFMGCTAENCTDDARLAEDLGLDSLEHVELVMFCEEEFGIEVPDDDAEKLLTVADCVNYITNKTGGGMAG